MTEPEPISKLLNQKEAAAFLGCTESTLQSWRSGDRYRYRLKFIRVGRLIRYRLSDLEEFVERRSDGGPKKKRRVSRDREAARCRRTARS